MKVFDPRRKEDFVINDRRFKRAFSSLHHNLYVVDSLDEKRLDETKLLKNCIPKTSNLGFFTLAPWIPGAKKIKNRIRQEFSSVQEYDGTLVGYFDVTRLDTIDTLFEIRANFGGYKTGEWGFGGCIEQFSLPHRISILKGVSWDFTHLIGQAEKIGCLLYIGDGYTTFLTKIFDDLDSRLTQSQFESH